MRKNCRAVSQVCELAGAVVTLDAMHCQKETLVAIRARGADYVIPVKANQPKLFESLQNLFESYGNRDYQDPAIRAHRTVEHNRGREEERIYYAAAAPGELRNSAEWLDVRSVLIWSTGIASWPAAPCKMRSASTSPACRRRSNGWRGWCATTGASRTRCTGRSM